MILNEKSMSKSKGEESALLNFDSFPWFHENLSKQKCFAMKINWKFVLQTIPLVSIVSDLEDSIIISYTYKYILVENMVVFIKIVNANHVIMKKKTPHYLLIIELSSQPLDTYRVDESIYRVRFHI